jgi:opacity protein-like surface antigen
MMRAARVVSCVLVGVIVMAVSSEAQTPAAGADASRFFAAVDFGATFGHKSSGSIGAEGGAQISGPFGVFVEGGRMFNVGTEDLDARAQVVANAIGGTVSASYKVNFFDVGVRYAPEMSWKAKPYVMLGVGVAQVRSETALAINGTTVEPESVGVQFGTDLDGSVKKALIVFGGGAMYPLMNRLFLDASFRYGRIAAKTSEIENDKGINTARLQLGIGYRF